MCLILQDSIRNKYSERDSHIAASLAKLGGIK